MKQGYGKRANCENEDREERQQGSQEKGQQKGRKEMSTTSVHLPTERHLAATHLELNGSSALSTPLLIPNFSKNNFNL